MRAEVFTRVQKMIADHFEVDPQEINDDTDFIKDLNADSISVMEFILELEDEFDVEIADEEIDSATTVKQVVDYINSKIK